MVSIAHPDLWSLALNQQQFAPGDLAEALEREAGRPPLDFRTRLLIRDSLDALRKAWGDERFAEWLTRSPGSEILTRIRCDGLGPAGFPSLIHRIMEPTRTDVVLQFLRELGQSIQSPTSISVVGSVALILTGLLSRRTEDIDVVNEVPVQIRSEHDLLNGLARRYGLSLTHFQSHYLPTGWESRLHRLDQFDRLEVRLVDSIDIFVGKLFSRREKDKDDLRVLSGRLDKAEIARHLRETGGAFHREKELRAEAEKNWYVIYGEPLPVAPL